jgi:hypothetical protein
MMGAPLVTVAVRLDPAPVSPSAAGHETVALEALGAARGRARRRFAERTPELLRFSSLMSGGHAFGTNRSPPYPPRTGADWMTLIA